MNRGDTDLYDALRAIEQTEDDLAAAVRGARRDAEGSSETPTLKAETVDDLRDDLTRARADLVDALLARELDTSTPTIDHNVPQRPLFEGRLTDEETFGHPRQRKSDE